MNILKLKLSILFFLISGIYFAQDKIWIDTDWKATTKEKATYYKLAMPQNGELRYFFKNATVAKKETYENGILDGDYSEYYESGNLKETGKYEEGKREGIWKTYYENGKIKIRGKYREGEKVGVWKTYYKNDY